MEIIIGREDVPENPRLALNVAGAVSFLGAPGSVPKSVSRRHCKITVREDGKITGIEDISSNNYMYVNGKECKSIASVSSYDSLELGPGHYQIDVNAIIRTVSGNPVYHIAHLSSIYEQYTRDSLQMQIEQGKLGVLSTLPMIITMGSGVLIGFIPGIPSYVKASCGIFALSLTAYLMFKRMRNSKLYPLRKKDLDDKFHKEYSCPNPNCRHSFGAMRYDDILHGRVCPWCKCKLVE